MPIEAIIIILRKTYGELKSQFLVVNAESNLKEKQRTGKKNRVKHMIKKRGEFIKKAIGLKGA